MSILEKVKRNGVLGSAEIAVRKSRNAIRKLKLKTGYTQWQFRHAPVYANPTDEELASIERDLLALGIPLHDYTPSPIAFRIFQEQAWFPSNYHGGHDSGVWTEKLLEHWISSEILGVMNYQPEEVYVDFAACASPWAQALRERKGVSAFAIDKCEVGQAYVDLPYYKIEDATSTSFADASLSGASLHCAYEMFMGQDDTALVAELARILKPGGKVVVLPLYMHTHYCAYATPEYFGRDYSDPQAKEYVRLDFSGIPSSRKYNAAKLKERVLDPMEYAGLRYRLMVLRNKDEFGAGVYCHFILEINK
jgi:SAM-dependent methyltransferase